MIKIDIRFEQKFYNLFGYSTTKIAEDNIDGPQTQNARRNFQKARKIVEDGKTGPQTLKEIIKVVQKIFNDKGISQLCIGGKLAEDGVFGKVSTDVTVCFQGKAKIAQDGVFYLVSLEKLASYKSIATTITTVTTPDWIRLLYTRDSQDTRYSCGPASLKMAFSVYGLNLSESWLIEKSGAKDYIGTSIQGVLDAVSAVNRTYGTKFTARNESFKDWETLDGYLRKGQPVILRVSSWLTKGGEHYVVLVGLNIKDGKVELGDPSNGGFRATTTADLLARIKKVSVASVIVLGGA